MIARADRRGARGGGARVAVAIAIGAAGGVASAIGGVANAQPAAGPAAPTPAPAAPTPTPAAPTPTPAAPAPAPAAPAPTPAAPAPKPGPTTADDARALFDLPPKPAPSPPTPPTPAAALAPARASSSAAASADDARSLFDLPPTPTPAAALDCSTLGAFGCLFVTDPAEAFDPAALRTTLGTDWLSRLPLAAATHDQIASFAAGTGADRYGVYVPGATSLENRWTIDGAPADDVRGGGAGTRVPVIFLDHVDVTTGGFAARDRASTGAIVDAELRRGGDRTEVRAYAWLGAAAPAATAAPARYAPLTGSVGAPRDLTVAATAGGPAATIAGARVWYFVGAQARLRPFTFTGEARRLVDANGDGVPDRTPDGPVTELVARRSADALYVDAPFVARVGARRGPHELTLTVVGDVAADTSFDPTATLAAGAIDQRTLTGDAIATYRGRWAGTRALVQWAWHRDAGYQRAHDDAAAAIPQLDTAFIPGAADLPDDAALAAACTDGGSNDPYPKIANCPLATGYFARGGAGLLTDVVADRPSVTASLAHVFGEHRVEAGVTGEDARLVVTRRLTAGHYVRSLFGVDTIDSRFVQLGEGTNFPDTCSLDGTVACRWLDAAVSTYRERSGAAWLADTWRPGAGIAVDAGARWEWLHLGAADPMSQLLPRIGAAWDPLGGGRSRVFAGFARTVPMLPGRLAETIGGGPTQLTTITLPIGSSDFLDETPGVRLALGTQPMLVDDVVVGGEVALAGALRLGVSGQWRFLRRALDYDGSLITNPGAGGGPAARRDSGALTIELATAPTARVALRLAYTYARAIGNWSGPGDPSLGADYYRGADFAGGTPLVGDLSSDLRHRVAIEAATSRRVGAYDLIVAGRAVAASGRPLGAFTDSGAVILARGAAGSTPPATAADIRLAVRRGGVEVGVDVADVFDHRPVALVDERYTGDAVRPIVGGDATDLPFLRTTDGTLAARDPGYGHPAAFVAPLTAVLYARAAF